MSDLRTLSRVTAAILMPIGPAAIALLRFVIPYAPAAEAAAADPDRYRLVLVLGAIATFTLVPGVYAALQLARRYRPGLSAWVGALLVPAYLALAATSAVDAIVVAGADLGLDPSAVTPLHTAVGELPVVMVTGVIFLVGHIVGTLLLGILAFRSRLMPRFVAVLLAVSQPLHLTAVILESNWLDLFAWGLTVVGMVFLARRVLQTPNDEWELPPISLSAPTREPASSSL